MKTYVENNGVLDDLDVRASDILQANCVLWVEGPSDRIYVRRWIELWSGGNLVEGVHYQCAVYGGRLLSHLSSKAPTEVEDGIALLRVNRNCIIIMDSDKRAPQTRINSTKRRIESEMNEIGGISWITKGKEIENYLPASAVEAYLGIPIGQVGQYDDFSSHLDAWAPGKGKDFLRRKPLFAEHVVPYLNIENAFSVLDLREQVGKLCESIKRWNAIPF
ncbi:MAG: hypothetical protein IPN69_03860 [Acidobacteria bacterium]|nr:hypothetical protein [Acidobacteriota bacterium]